MSFGGLKVSTNTSGMTAFVNEEVPLKGLIGEPFGVNSLSKLGSANKLDRER